MAKAGQLREAEELLEEVDSWDKEEIEGLPELYQRKARAFRMLSQKGEG